MNKMQQVQKHLIKSNYRNYQEIALTRFASRNRDNSGIYICRKAFGERTKFPPINKF